MITKYYEIKGERLQIHERTQRMRMRQDACGGKHAL